MKITFSANSFIHIYKLRFDVIKKLKDLNYQIVIVAGDDDFKNIIEKLGFETYSVNIQPNKKKFLQIYI